ncbi:MAG: alpha/beta hydrolase fold domain-containing protein [Desulfobacteraceae bacterium]|nr:alpha/beta hydrolase fold domain-containing protein [Desulfobacteraceae bacterium]MBC2752580.1 dienelactone hydrolase family protein [Desulfobacteraceae bacterium]
MRYFRLFLLLITITLIIPSCAEKQIRSSLIDAPTGRIYFQTASPYDYKDIASPYDHNDIYDRLDSDKKAVIYGDLEISEGTVGKVPAVVLIHGSGGVSSKHLKWINRLQEMGIATFRVNSFSGRNISSTVGKQEDLPTPAMIVDAYMALNLLSTHPRIDKNKIGVLGGSKGGVVALYSAYEPIRANLAEGDNQFDFHVAIYPLCQKLEKVSMTGSPILILIGGIDDWTPPAWCEALSESLINHGYDVELQIYPGAYHSFDSDNDIYFNKRAYNFEDCDFVLLEEGAVLERNSGIKMDTPENYKEALRKCVKRGVHGGGNPAAATAALDDMEAFVKKVINSK